MIGLPKGLVTGKVARLPGVAGDWKKQSGTFASTRMCLVIVLPLPPRCLSPNGRYHWATVAKAKKAQRAQAASEAKHERELVGVIIPWTRAYVEPHFFFRDKRRRDTDNLAASLKAARDGLADANVVVNDCDIVNCEPVIDYDRDNPRVELWVSYFHLGDTR